MVEKYKIFNSEDNLDKQKPKINKEIFSTAKNLEDYMERVFPECNSEDELLKFLTNKVTLDVGSGLTHINPFSLINTIYRKNEEIKKEDEKINFRGAEPRMLGEDDTKFSFNDWLKEKMNVFVERAVRKKLFTPYKKIKKDQIEPAFAQKLPYRNGTIDILLSVGLVGYHIIDKQEMDTILKEFYRVLKNNGEVRLHVKEEVKEKKLFNELIENENAEYHFVIDKEYENKIGYIKLIKTPLKNKGQGDFI